MMINYEQAIGLGLTNTGGGFLDVTTLLWPRYTRESGTIGGDLAARSTFETDLNGAGDWLDRLGWGFIESYSGLTTWQGKLAKVTADLYGQVVSTNLREVYNSVIVVYQKTLGGSDNETTAAINGASVIRYGFRQLVYNSPIILSDSAAIEVRDGLLAARAWPRVKAEQLKAAGAGGVSVSLEFDGLIKTLQVQYYAQTTGSDLDADQAILLTMGGATEIDLGNIESNNLSVSRRSAIVDIWSRIKEIAALGDSLGNFWAIGSYAGNRLNYYKPDINSISYYADLDRDNRLIYYDTGGNVLAPATLKPARVLFRRDLYAGRPINKILLNDQRAMLIGSIRFSRNGAQIGGLGIDTNATWQALISQLTPAEDRL